MKKLLLLAALLSLAGCDALRMESLTVEQFQRDKQNPTDIGTALNSDGTIERTFVDYPPALSFNFDPAKMPVYQQRVTILTTDAAGNVLSSSVYWGDYYTWPPK